MEKKVNEEKVKEAGAKVISVLVDMELNAFEVVETLESLKDSFVKYLLLKALFGDKADDLIEKMVEDEIISMLEEAERIAKGEE